jgi:signal transduction histidine kinase
MINESVLSAYAVKIGYALPVDDDWWIASGMYLSDLESESGVSLPPGVSALVDFVSDARDYARDAGREDAVAAFNDPKGVWTNGSLYIYGLDYNGTLLAQPYDPENLGRDHSGIVRTYGVKSVEQAARIAGDGGGFFVYYISDPVSGTEEGKLSYVLPVDDEWFIGSGIYLDDLIASLEEG